MKNFFISSMLFFSLALFAQESGGSKFGFGLGLGQMFGGIGVQMNYDPISNLELFTGLGYNLADLGFNAGAKYKISESRTAPFLTAMYGYNAAVIVSGTSGLDKTFYGATLGGGFDFESRNSENYWTFAILIPIRSREVAAYQNFLTSTRGIVFTGLFPITISGGYVFKF